MKKFSAFLLVAFFTFSCGGGFDRKVETDKVFAIHDEVMPKIQEVMDLRKKTLDKAKSLDATDLSNKELTDLRMLAAELENARKGMMTWMNDWSKNAKPHTEGTSTEEEQKAFFASEMERVTKVKEDINNSIEKAKKALK